MKLLNIVILSTYAIAAFALFDGKGMHNDGHFLSGNIKGRKACDDGEFNRLDVASDPAGDIEGYDDGTKLITNCKPCTTANFKAVYTVQVSGFNNDHASLNRKECCYNEDLVSCREMLRAYQEGCNRGGDAGDNRPLKDDGNAGTCAN